MPAEPCDLELAGLVPDLLEVFLRADGVFKCFELRWVHFEFFFLLPGWFISICLNNSDLFLCSPLQ